MKRTLKVGSREKSWDLPLVEAFDLGHPFRRTRRGIQRTEKDPQRRDGKLVPGWVHPLSEERFFEQEM